MSLPPSVSALHYWLALKFVPRLAARKKLELVENIGLAKLFIQPLPAHLALTDKQKQAIEQPDWQRIEHIIAQLNAIDCYAVCYDDASYPAQLKQIFDPPLVLFVKGNIELLAQPQVAIVGSRSASISGREVAKRFAHESTQAGLVVTSGLALGVDGAAHQGCLAANGPTIAVVATGLEQVYPKRHRQLANDIVNSGGAIVSEFLPGTFARAGHFPKRNRLISGLSLGVLLVEAGLPSGSLITAKMALEQNREVFAVPGSINNPLAKGCHWLIKQGAHLVENTDDILAQLGFTVKAGHISGQGTVQEVKALAKTEKNQQQDLLIDPLLASVGYETTPVDIVVSRSGLVADEVLTRLTLLELKGLIAAVPGGYLRLEKG